MILVIDIDNKFIDSRTDAGVNKENMIRHTADASTYIDTSWYETEKEACKLWQFYDDVEDEEALIKEKEQIMSSPDLGHDLTSIRLLLTKHKVQY